jgi:predicted acyl esterase
MSPTCSFLVLLLLLAAPALAQDITMVPVTVDGETVQLAMRIYKPSTGGPAPTLVFNHGSTGRGTDPSIFVRPIDFPPLAQFFVERGWAVVMPARRGRGGSEGQYDEGFAPNRRLATPASRRCRSPVPIVPCVTWTPQW